MKNFKKVLALVLVVAMIASFATMATATFTDGETITKAEAVDVLSAIGVINGYEDGSFKPEGTVTRAEMAKMIATILNKGEDVGAMYAGACTFADAASHWAAGYVAYCAQEGIINGRNATTFDPDATVTGNEAAKMVLGALGHDGEVAGLTGPAWASNTLSLAKKNNMIGEENNMTANMGQALTRENAAQLLLNGLKAKTAYYEGGSTITIGDITMTQGAECKYNTTTLREECFPKLKPSTTTTDVFGRSCVGWTFEGEDVGFYSVDPFITYTGEVTLHQLYTDLGKVGYQKIEAAETGKVEYHVDGADYNDGVDLLKEKKDNVYTFASGNAEDTIGGQGVLTEVYFDELTLELNVVEINTYAAEITTVTAAKTDASGDVIAEEYVTVKPLSGAPESATGYTLTNGINTGKNTFVTDAYTSTTADKGTIVYYTIGVDPVTAKTQIQTVATATSVTGVNQGYSSIDGTVTEIVIDGITYQVNSKSGYKAGTIDQAETVYFDGNGNAIYTTGVASTDYAYMIGAAATTNFSKSFSAQMLFEDGTVKIVELAATHDSGAGLVASDVDKVDNKYDGTIYTYAVGTDGKYTLTAVKAENQKVVAEGAVTNKVPTIDSKTANANTVFVVGVVDATGTTYTTYTGIAAVPSYTGEVAYAMDTTTNTIAVAFCLDADITGAGTAASMVLFKNTGEVQNAKPNGNNYRTVDALINGTATTVTVTEDVYASLGSLDFTFASAGVVDANGNYSKLTKVEANKENSGLVSFNSFGGYADGIVTLGEETVYVDATIPVYIKVNAVGGIKTTTIDAITTITAGSTGYYTYEVATEGGTPTITGIYLRVPTL